MSADRRPLKKVGTWFGTVCGLLLVAMLIALVYDPMLLPPTQPWWRWVMGVAGAGLLVAAGEVVVSAMAGGSGVREIVSSREPVWVKAVAVLLALLLACAGLAVALGIWRLVVAR